MEGQAEYLRVPYADFNVVKLYNTDNLHEKDFVLLTYIFPTGWGGVAQSGFKPGNNSNILSWSSMVNACLQC
jgi:glutathione-independent formaldehyde dehydrogenase